MDSYEVERRIIACLVKDKESLLYAIDKLKPEHFETDIAHLIYLVVHSFCEEEADRSKVDALGLTALKLLIKDNSRKEKSPIAPEQIGEINSYIDELNNLDDDSYEFSVDWLCDYASRKQAEIALREAAVTLRSGGSAADAIETLLNNYSTDDEGENLVPESLEKGFIDRFKSRKSDLASGDNITIPLGFPLLDAGLEGGIRTGEIMLIAGSVGVGKSFVLDTIGVNIYKAGYSVLKITTENTKEQSLCRAESIVYKLNYRELQNCKDSIPLTKIEKYIEKNPSPCDHITIRLFPERHGAADVFREMIKLKIKHNFDPDVIVFDSPDFLKLPTGNYGDRKHDLLTRVYLQFKEWIEKKNKALIASSHTKMSGGEGIRAKKSGGRRLDIGDLSDSSGKARLCDTLITLNTNDELSDLGLVEMYVAKGRDIVSRPFSVMIKRARHYPGFIEDPNQ